MKVRRIREGSSVRCMGWHGCCEENCQHFRPHSASFDRGCTHQRQVRYCPRARGFVTDVYLSDIDSNLKGNPNLAFKHKKAIMIEEESYHGRRY